MTLFSVNSHNPLPPCGATHKHPVGALLESDQPVPEVAACTTHEYTCYQRDWNPRSQQSSCHRLPVQTARQLGWAWYDDCK